MASSIPAPAPTEFALAVMQEMRPAVGALRVGGLRRTRNDCLSGSWTTHGATTARTARKVTTPRPSRMSHGMRRPRGRVFCMTARANSVGAGAGIEEAIEEIDDEVDDDEHHRGEEDRALHHRIIAVVDG